MEIKRDILWRVYLSFLGIVVIGLVVLGRAFYIQRVQGSHWIAMADSLHQRIVALDADRGTIYSDNGEMLSTSLPYFDIYMDFKADGLIEKNGKRFRENLDAFSAALARQFPEKSKLQYKRDLEKGYKSGTRYYPLLKKMSFEDYKAFREFPLVNQGRNKSGVIVEVNNKRVNPYGLLANRTIGLARENAQNVGLENTYDSLLKGQTGKRLVRFIAGGAAMPVEGYEIEPENGKDIITTLDVNMQDIAENALMRMMVESESAYGTCVVMETRTGQIKAMANLGRQKDGSYWEDYNYALRTTEPGSTIKLATLLSVLSEGSSKVNDLVNVGSTGSAYVGVRNVTDAERAPKPVMTLEECFAHSSNVGLSMVAYKAFAKQPDKFKEYLHQFHLDRATGVDLLGEEKPRLPRLKRNNEGLHAMVTMSFGYAIEVSPLQTLTLYNAIANNGRMMKPYLVSRVEKNGIVVKENKPEALESMICDEDIVKAAQQCMRDVVTEGTGKPAMKGVNFPVAGKTGTAHVAGKNIKYGDGVYQATFVGYFPADTPEYTCIVVIRTKPHALQHYGGQLAAPVFREIATKLYAMRSMEQNPIRYSVPADSTAFFYAGQRVEVEKVLNTLRMNYADSAGSQVWSRVYGSRGNPVVQGTVMTGKQMPDVRGMSLKDALYVLENLGVKVDIKGKGKVISQSVPAGSGIDRKTNVWLNLGI